MQKTSIIFDITIPCRDSQVQQNIWTIWFSFEQSSTFVEKNLRYPLPRHSFSALELSLKMNIHESVGIKTFNEKMILAKTWKHWFKIPYTEGLLYQWSFKKLVEKKVSYKNVKKILLTFGLRLNLRRKLSWKRQT